MRSSRAALVAAVLSALPCVLAGGLAGVVAPATCLLAALSGCKRDEPAPDRKPAPAPHQDVKRAIDRTPLPALAKDRGGATGKPLWAIGFGGLGIDAPRAIAVAPGGDSYAVGYFDGEAEFGAAGKHRAADNDKDPKHPGTDAFLVRIDPDGKIAWARTFGAGRDDAANGVAVRGDRIVVVGQFLDRLELGELKHAAAGSDDMFVAAFDLRGEPQWLWTAGGLDSDGANAVVATPDGGWVVGGSFRSSSRARSWCRAAAPTRC
jgi:hypothetical protein